MLTVPSWIYCCCDTPNPIFNWLLPWPLRLHSDFEFRRRFWGWKSEEKGSGFHRDKESKSEDYGPGLFYVTCQDIFAVKILDLWGLGPPFKIRWTHITKSLINAKLQNKTLDEWKWTVYFTLTNGPRIKMKQFFLFGKMAFFFRWVEWMFYGGRVTPSLHKSTNYHLWSLLQLHNNTICKMYIQKVFSRSIHVQSREIQVSGTTI